MARLAMCPISLPYSAARTARHLPGGSELTPHALVPVAGRSRESVAVPYGHRCTTASSTYQELRPQFSESGFWTSRTGWTARDPGRLCPLDCVAIA